MLVFLQNLSKYEIDLSQIILEMFDAGNIYRKKRERERGVKTYNLKKKNIQGTLAKKKLKEQQV